MIKRKIAGQKVIRWAAITGAVMLILVVIALALIQTFIYSMGPATRQTLSWLVVGAVICLVLGTAGLLFGLNRLWLAGQNKKNVISHDGMIVWIVVLAIGLPLLASGFSGQGELHLFGIMGAQFGSQAGFLEKWSLPASFYLLQALVLAVMVYTLLLKPGRLAPGFISAYQGGVWPLVTGGLFGLAGGLAGIFLLRVAAAVIPSAWGTLPFYLENLSSGPYGRLNWTQILIMLGLAPLAEELFLRGFVLPDWTRKWGAGLGWAATAALSSFFALNLAAVPIIFLFSLSLCWLAGHVKHLAPVWVAHLVFVSFYLFLMPN